MQSYMTFLGCLLLKKAKMWNYIIHELLVGEEWENSFVNKSRGNNYKLNEAYISHNSSLFMVCLFLNNLFVDSNSPIQIQRTCSYFKTFLLNMFTMSKVFVHCEHSGSLSLPAIQISG